MTLAYVEKHIINTLITICAQPTSIQGVRLIESVIHPDCLRFPSRAQDREDQCVEITYLKQQLRKKLKRGEQHSYDWKWTPNQRCGHLQNHFIDLLSSDIYEEFSRHVKHGSNKRQKIHYLTPKMMNSIKLENNIANKI